MHSQVIEIVVQAHPGIIAQVAGLVARRGFDLEGIEYAIGENRSFGRVRLRVRDDGRLERLERELSRLHDVTRIVATEGETEAPRGPTDVK